jgi:hypothetical protein
MAQFPQYDRKVSASGIQSPFRQKSVNTEYAKSLQTFGGQVEQAGLTIADIDNKIQRIEQARKSTDAQIQISKKLNEYNYKFASDPNPDNWQGYYDGLQQDVEGIVNEVDDQYVKEELLRDARLRTDNAISGMQIKAIGRNLAKSRSNLEISKNESVYSVDSNDHSIINDARLSYQNELEKHAELEGLPQEWVAQELRDRDKVAAKRWLFNTAESNPDLASKMLDSGSDSGLTQYFTSEEIMSLREKIAKIKSKEELEFERVQEEAKVEVVGQVTEALQSGTLNAIQLENLKEQYPSMKSDLNKIGQILDSQVDQEKLEPDEYVRIMNKLYKDLYKGNGELKKKIGKAQVKSLAAIQTQAIDLVLSGKITRDELQEITSITGKMMKQPNFMKEYAAVPQMLDIISEWAGNSTANILRRSPNAKQDVNGFAYEVVSSMMKEIKKGANPAALYEKLQTQLSMRDEEYARALYKISAPDASGKSLYFDPIDNVYYPISGYKECQPIFEKEFGTKAKSETKK